MMQLKRIKVRRCPKCNCTKVQTEGHRIDHSKPGGGVSEHRDFACGYGAHCYAGEPVRASGCREYAAAVRRRERKREYFAEVQKAVQAVKGPRRLKQSMLNAVTHTRMRHSAI